MCSNACGWSRCLCMRARVRMLVYVDSCASVCTCGCSRVRLCVRVCVFVCVPVFRCLPIGAKLKLLNFNTCPFSFENRDTLTSFRAI